MSVAIRKMIYEEFEQFYQWSVEQQAKELMEELHISREDAMKSAIAEISEMLPNGFHTKYHQLLTVVAEDESMLLVLLRNEDGTFIDENGIYKFIDEETYNAIMLGIFFNPEF